MNTKNKLVAEIKGILVTRLNEFIADSIIRVNCKRIGVDSDFLDHSLLDDFSEKIKSSLILFLSEEETEKIVQKIKEIK